MAVVKTSHIPNDLALSILSKLSIKSLNRFTCVQKSWSLLFQNPDFMNMFRTNFISNHDEDEDNMTCLLLKERTRTIAFGNHNTMYTLSSDKFEDMVRLDWPSPFQENDSHIEILGSASVNGILCLHQEGTDNDSTTIFWNPATGEFKIIPHSLQPYDDIEFNHRPEAFGYDRVRDDYKLIRYAQYPEDFEGNWVYVPEKNSTFWEFCDIYGDESLWEGRVVEMYDPFWEIYSLKSNSWKKLDVVDMPVPWPGRSLVNLNELSHWLGFERNMLTFDFSNEKFYATNLPLESDTIYNYWIEFDLMVLNGSAAFICSYDETKYFHIWILGELGVQESWTKLFIVGPLTYIRRPIGSGKRSYLFFTTKDNDLVQFDLSTQRFEEIEIYVPQVITYKEILLPIEGMNN
ncbi:F-box protein CPR1-like [Cicer arietinum]|uniref:F-box protein CPR1-like n=1 Tax=Cicer arietinum TaxID=3827 RepID=A0A1S2YW86_CICAR|nr:F-box protein CPR1-like [Cicer arietinum]